MKIAVVSDDGQMVSQHFGRAPYYVVLTLEDGRVVHRESRDKLGHMDFGGQHNQEHHEHHHGSGEEADHRHNMMIAPICDCEVLVASGMGAGAYEAVRSQGVRPVVTDIKLIDDVAKAFVDGQLVDHRERIHR
jgi:predicted Fe-Mo cluster-binding NifX family protein